MRTWGLFPLVVRLEIFCEFEFGSGSLLYAEHCMVCHKQAIGRVKRKGGQGEREQRGEVYVETGQGHVS